MPQVENMELYCLCEMVSRRFVGGRVGGDNMGLKLFEICPRCGGEDIYLIQEYQFIRRCDGCRLVFSYENMQLSYWKSDGGKITGWWEVPEGCLCIMDTGEAW